MIDAKVSYRGQEATVLRYEPLGSGMCDTLIREGERECWVSSHELKRLDGGTVPDRREVLRQADRDTLKALQEIRAKHVEDFHKPWPGMEFGKAMLGQSIDGAIAAVEERLG